MQTPLESNAFFFHSVYCIIFNSSWQLMFDKEQKKCVKRIHLVTEGNLCDSKAFYKVKIAFIYSQWMVANILIVNSPVLFAFRWFNIFALNKNQDIKKN